MMLIGQHSNGLSQAAWASPKGYFYTTTEQSFGYLF